MPIISLLFFPELTEKLKYIWVWRWNILQHIMFAIWFNDFIFFIFYAFSHFTSIYYFWMNQFFLFFFNAFLLQCASKTIKKSNSFPFLLNIITWVYVADAMYQWNFWFHCESLAKEKNNGEKWKIIKTLKIWKTSNLLLIRVRFIFSSSIYPSLVFYETCNVLCIVSCAFSIFTRFYDIH